MLLEILNITSHLIFLPELFARPSMVRFLQAEVTAMRNGLIFSPCLLDLPFNSQINLCTKSLLINYANHDLFRCDKEWVSL